MPAARRIPEATVTRLPLYLRVLEEAAAQRTMTVSSEDLAERVGFSAAQIRRDLSCLGSFGIRGVGYEVEYLMLVINRQLGLDGERRVAIVGAGNLGQALARYGGFSARGFRVVAAFDADPAKVGTLLGDTRVSDASGMLEGLRGAGVEIAVITTPAQAAQRVVDVAVQAGVGSILNFAPTSVAVPEGVALRQVDLGIELQILSFYRHRVGDPAGV